MSDPVVYVVDDEEVVRNSVRWLLESVNLKVKTFSSGEAFLENYSIYDTGCLLLDIRMPGMSGLQLQKKLLAQKYALPVIIITGHGDVPLAVGAMKSGAMDFIQKPYNDQGLIDCVQRAIELDRKNYKLRLHYDSINARLENLTPREKQVMKLVLEQDSNKVIAEKLGIAIKTVEFHRSRLMSKMHAKTVLDLADMVRPDML